MRPFLSFAVLTALALTVAPASADEPEKPTQFTADAAYVQTGGNTDVMTLSGSEKLEHKRGPWLFTQDAAAVWGETEGVENAGRYRFGLRADYALNSRLSIYGLGLWQRNTFAGISRQFNEGAGVSFKAIVPKPHQLDLEAGLGLVQRRTTAALEEDFATARLAVLYRYYWSDKAYLEAFGGETINLEDSEDRDTEGRFALVAPLTSGVAMRIGYDLYHRNRPQPGFEKLDTTFSAGLQVSY